MKISELFNNQEDVEVKKEVLIVDDDPLFRQIYQDVLEKNNFLVTTASNGQEALESVNKKKPNAILLDITMPVMDGLEVLRQLWDSNVTNEVPVIVLTNAGDVKNMERAQFYSSYKFYVKSNVTPEEILKTLKEAIHVTQPYS